MDLFGEENGSSLEKESRDTKLVVNKGFAKAYEDRKSKEEYKRLATESRFDDDAKDGDSETSESEDEDAEQLTPGLDLEITRTMNRIRNRDPAIYDAQSQFYSTPTLGDNDEDDGQICSTVVKSHKALKYKDVARQQILDAKTSRDAVSSSEDEDEFYEDTTTTRNGKAPGNATQLAYNPEQRLLRENLLRSLDKDEGEDTEGEFLKHKPKSKQELAEEERVLAEEASQLMLGLPEEDETFLVDFMMNRRWKEKPTWKTADEEEISDSGDEGNLCDQDDFEAKYNFRFQEEGGGEIKSYTRNVQGSLRRQDDHRKKEREAYRLRKLEERQRKAEELRRLKKLKRKDIAEKLERIRMLSGGYEVGEALLEDEFNPDAWDEQMTKTFDDQYYAKKDDKTLGDVLKPEFDVMQDMEEEDGDFYRDEGEEERDEEGLVNGEEDNVVKKEKQDVAKLIDDLYKLDYEDLIGDQPCRFKYRQVQEDGFGLSAQEILLAEDRELDEFVNMKKLAPYRTAPIKVDRKKRRNIRLAISERQKALEGAAKSTEDGSRNSSRRRRKRAKRSSSSDQKEGLEENANNMKEGEKDDGTTTASSVANTPFSMESSTSGNKTSGNSQSVNTTRVPERTIQDKDLIVHHVIEGRMKNRRKRENSIHQTNSEQHMHGEMVVEENLQECAKGRNTGTAAHGGDGPRMDPCTVEKDPATPSITIKKKKKRTKKETNHQSRNIPEAAANMSSIRLAAYGFG